MAALTLPLVIEDAIVLFVAGLIASLFANAIAYRFRLASIGVPESAS